MTDNMSQTVLVTGATGFVGRALCAQLHYQGWGVRASVRRLNSLGNTDASEVMVGDLDGDTDWSVAVAGASAVVHLAARVHVMNDQASNPLIEFRRVNVLGTLRLARQAAQAGAKRFVYISSIKALGEVTQPGEPYTEVSPTQPSDAYGISKQEAEQGLRELAAQTGLEVVIIRPPLVYGSGVKANFAALMRAIQRGLPLPLGSVHNARSLVGIDNLVDFIATCLLHPEAANQTFMVSDGKDLSTTGLIRAMAQAADVSPRLLPVPVWALRAAASLLGKREGVKRLCGNLQVDITKARTVLHWTPPVTVGEGLRRSMATGGGR
jgi:nucleoside-diphosphate-sugar epimerase